MPDSRALQFAFWMGFKRYDRSSDFLFAIHFVLYPINSLKNLSVARWVHYSLTDRLVFLREASASGLPSLSPQSDGARRHSTTGGEQGEGQR